MPDSPVQMNVQVTAAELKEVTGFLERIGGVAGLVESLLAVPAGWLQHWRQENLVRWFKEYERESAARVAEGKRPIPPSLLMPALQHVVQEDNDDMLKTWAILLANFEMPDYDFKPRKVFVSLLGDMSAIDVKVLQFLVVDWPLNTALAAELAQGRANEIGVRAVADHLGGQVQVRDVTLSLHNLARLGCLMSKIDEGVSFIATPSLTKREPAWLVRTAEAEFYVTPLGAALVQACQPAESRSI